MKGVKKSSSSRSESDATLDFILNELVPALPNEHIARLHDHVGLLRKKTRSERSLSPDELEFYDILTSRLRRFVLGGFNVGKEEGKSSVPRARGFNKKEFSKGFEALQDFWRPMNLSRRETMRMYSLYSDSLIFYVKSLYPEEQGLKGAVKCMGRVREVLDLSFPGYFSQGIAGPKARAAVKFWLARG